MSVMRPDERDSWIAAQIAAAENEVRTDLQLIEGVLTGRLPVTALDVLDGKSSPVHKARDLVFAKAVVAASGSVTRAAINLGLDKLTISDRGSRAPASMLRTVIAAYGPVTQRMWETRRRGSAP